MRPSRTVARAALIAAIALGALPGLVGSHEPSQDRPLDAALFDQVNLAKQSARQGVSNLALDAAGRSSGAIKFGDRFTEPMTGVAGASAGERANPGLESSKAGWSWRKPSSVIRGSASFYDHGTTAMRDVPRGTVVVICGAGGCIERTVSDYGPAKSTGRVIDMYRPDFFQVCGCGWWSGTTTVEVRIY